MNPKRDPRAIYGARGPGQCTVCRPSDKYSPYCRYCGYMVPPRLGMCGNFTQDPKVGIAGDQWVRCGRKKHSKGLHRALKLTWTSENGAEWEDEFPQHYTKGI